MCGFITGANSEEGIVSNGVNKACVLVPFTRSFISLALLSFFYHPHVHQLASSTTILLGVVWLFSFKSSLGLVDVVVVVLLCAMRFVPPPFLVLFFHSAWGCSCVPLNSQSNFCYFRGTEKPNKKAAEKPV
jgi:hypothetical protein